MTYLHTAGWTNPKRTSWIRLIKTWILCSDDHDLLEDVHYYNYLTEKRYKDGLNQNQKRVIRKNANNIFIVDVW